MRSMLMHFVPSRAMEEPLVNFLWGECSAGVRRCLGWKSPADVRAAVEAVRVLQFVEWFCGTGNLTTACRQLGLRVGWFDCILDSEAMNVLTDQGMARAITLSLSLMVGATAWLGVPCSTFVFMSRGHTLRSRKQPLGNTCRLDVKSANRIVRRIMFLVRILAMRKVYWILEQPLNSLLWVMPEVRLKKIALWTVWHGSEDSFGWAISGTRSGSLRSWSAYSRAWRRRFRQSVRQNETLVRHTASGTIQRASTVALGTRG